MTRAVIVHADAIPPRPWQNGRGVARELLAGDGWRISLADIDADGQFSAYPGVRRCFAVVEGAGVVLDLGAAPRRVSRFETVAFDGAAAPQCRLIDGPVRALNLLLEGDVRGTLCRALDTGWPLRGRYTDRVLEWDVHGDDDGPRQLWIGIAP